MENDIGDGPLGQGDWLAWPPDYSYVGEIARLIEEGELAYRIYLWTGDRLIWVYFTHSGLIRAGARRATAAEIEQAKAGRLVAELVKAL